MISLELTAAEQESEQERSKKGPSSRTFLDGPNFDLVHVLILI
jgi:hypothetical protein